MSGYYTEDPLCGWVEERDMALLEKYRVWILDPKETLSSPKPFDLWCLQHNYDNRGEQYGHEAMAVPECRGFECRLRNGWVYVAAQPTTPEEKAAREPLCRERLAPWIEDFEREYRKYTEPMLERYHAFQAIDMETLEDFQLQEAFDGWVEIYRLGGYYHFPAALAAAMIYLQFGEVCLREAGVSMFDGLFSDMMAGFDHKILEDDRGLFRLGARARELGLELLFRQIKDDDELYAELRRIASGRVWLNELDEHLWVFGWRTPENWDCSHPSWVERPSLSFPSIRCLMARPTFMPDDLRPSLVAKRQAAEREVLLRVAEEKRTEFLRLLRAAQWCGVEDQDHVYHFEHYSNALGRKVTVEVAKRFVAQDIIAEPDDIYYLFPDEISLRILGRYSAQQLVAVRKKQHAEFRANEPPERYIGDPEAIPWALACSPVLRATAVSFPRVKPELGADVYATVSTPGVVEGEVCVLHSVDEFDQFPPGAILVAPQAATTWTPIFNLAKAVVVDIGGVLSHTAILGREYGIPVLAGCQNATKKLTDGMKIKVDGDVGAAWILEE